MAKRTESAATTLHKWTETDLAAAAAAGRLAPAYEVDSVLDRIFRIAAAGKNPVLAGPSGIGKTAVVHELARRIHADSVPAHRS